MGVPKFCCFHAILIFLFLIFYVSISLIALFVEIHIYIYAAIFNIYVAIFMFTQPYLD